MRGRPVTALWGLISLLILAPSVAGAQRHASVDDQFVLERLALTELRNKTHANDPERKAAFFEGLVLEPRLIDVQEMSFIWSPRASPLRTAEQSLILARLLGSGVVLAVDDPCTAYSCRIGAHRGLLAFTPAMVRGDSASIDVRVHYWHMVRTEPRMTSFIERYTFVRDGADWRFVRSELLIIS